MIHGWDLDRNFKLQTSPEYCWQTDKHMCEWHMMWDKHTCKWVKLQVSISACFVPGALYKGQYAPRNFQVWSPVILKLQKVFAQRNYPKWNILKSTWVVNHIKWMFQTHLPKRCFLNVWVTWSVVCFTTSTMWMYYDRRVTNHKRVSKPPGSLQHAWTNVRDPICHTIPDAFRYILHEITYICYMWAICDSLARYLP